MPLYQYIYLDPNSIKKKNIIYGASKQEAREKLLKSHTSLISLYDYTEERTAYTLNQKDLAKFIEEIKELISSHMTLLDALILLENRSRKPKYHNILSSLREMVQSGLSLSFALSQFPKSFPPSVVSLVRSGENSGKIDQALMQLHQLLSWQLDLRKKISQALAYPIFLLLFSMSILLLLLLYVIPSLKELFDPEQLKGISFFVFATSNFLRSYGAPLSIITLSLASILIFYKRYVHYSFKIPWKKLPWINQFYREIYLLSFSKILSLLLSSHLPLCESITTAAESVEDNFLKSSLTKASLKVQSGNNFSESLQELSFISPFFIDMIQVGEASSNLSQSLLGLSHHYEKSIQDKIQKLQTYAQPILLMIIGLIIGIIMLAIFIPLSDLSQMQL